MFCHNRCKGILICVSSCFHNKSEDKTEMNCIGLISLPSILNNNQKNCCFKIVDIWHMRYIIMLQETIAIVVADTCLKTDFPGLNEPVREKAVNNFSTPLIRKTQLQNFIKNCKQDRV